MNKRCAVIGAGIGGIGSALRMAAKGYDVTVFEQSSIPGGKISQFQKDGFRFDTGPSLFTLPVMVDELFQLFGETPGDHFRYTKLPMSCKYFWDDKTIINAWQESDKFAGEIEQKTGIKKQRVEEFFKKSSELYDITAEIFMFNSLHKVKNYFRPDFRKSMLRFHKIDAFKTMHKKNKQWFRHPKVVQLFDRYATYNGSNPYKTPATLNIISHLEHNIGAFFPNKGMYSIVESLVALGKRHHIKWEFNSKVEKVIVEDNMAQSLVVKGKQHKFDIIISNMDITNFYKHLLPEREHPQSRIHNEPSTSALIFYWGINKQYNELEVHNILFSGNYKNEFDHLSKLKTISNDPTVYIFISSKSVKGDAPEGKENWYVMINVPENTGQNWDELTDKARKDIIQKINKVLNTDIEQHILFEKIADPRTIEQDTGSHKGALYGTSSNNKFAAFLRHPNFRKGIKNIFFTGGSVHPGGGIPLCLASAKIVDKHIH